MVEAPHLTSLYEKYQAKGFTVLAVNAYDEPKAKIEAFVRSRKLTHPIALEGGKIGREAFLVSAFPTAYWIGRDGRIIERSTGFKDGDEAKIERQLKALLEAPK